MMMSGVTRGLHCVAVLALWLLCANAHAARPVILVYGDSISAAHGMDEDRGWAHLLSLRLQRDNSPFRVVNASASGETTDGGMIRLPKTLHMYQPAVVVLELGGNDGLRGYPIDRIQGNLEQMVKLAKSSGASVLLIGMVLPPNYGKRYTDAFSAIYPAVAAKSGVPFIPYLLDGVKTPRNLLQSDGIHPTPEAQPMIMKTVLKRLEPLLKQVKLKGHVATHQ